MAPPRILLDCRWLNSGGAGRLTELLLRGLAAAPGEESWVLWGPRAVEDLAWPGAEVVFEPHDPRMWNGQRNWFDLPRCDLTVFLHQQRPMRRVRSVTLIHDTIPLHFATGPIDREIKRRFLRRSASISEHVLTPSEHSRRCIVSELGVAADKVSVFGCPADPEMAARVAAVRRSHPAEPFALYLGLFLPHKNLERLMEAFGATSFRSGGGRLILMGGSRAEHASLEARLTPGHREYVEARPFGSQQDLEGLLGTCRMLVQPSLEEGFGLPAWEALCCGVPVCASDGGSLPEVTKGKADEFPATSLDRMIEALDACASRGASRTPKEAEAEAEAFRRSAPSVDDLALQVREVVLRSAPNRSRA